MGRTHMARRIGGQPFGLVSTVLALILTALAVPAGATHGGIHPTFSTQDVFFQCNGATKVQNLHWPATWDPNPPVGSAQQGAGCGVLDPSGIRNTDPSGGGDSAASDGIFRGTFAGNLRDFTFRIHSLLLTRARITSTTGLTVRVTVDGEPVLRNEYNNEPETNIAVTPVTDNSGLTELMEFSVTNLGQVEDVYDEQGRLVGVANNGLATEDGDGQRVREVVVNIDTQGLPHGALWVWDAIEVPSGITFNPSTLAQTTVRSTLGDG